MDRATAGAMVDIRCAMMLESLELVNRRVSNSSIVHWQQMRMRISSGTLSNELGVPHRGDDFLRPKATIVQRNT